MTAPVLAGEGTHTGGGGEPLEMRVDEIRSDILRWIGQGGARGLKLPERISLEAYVSDMVQYLAPQYVVVGFVTEKEEREATDPELKVSVDSQPKACRGFDSVKDNKPHILCNYEKFNAASPAERYRLIHHEYAGLAGVELNLGASSDYEISRQITEFLGPETTWRLAVRRVPHPEGTVAHCNQILDGFGFGSNFLQVEEMNVWLTNGNPAKKDQPFLVSIDLDGVRSDGGYSSWRMSPVGAGWLTVGTEGVKEAKQTHRRTAAGLEIHDVVEFDEFKIQTDVRLDTRTKRLSLRQINYSKNHLWFVPTNWGNPEVQFSAVLQCD